MYAIVDVETTGLRPARDKIIEVAVVITDGEKVIDQFSTLVHPECVLPQYITSLTSISDNMLHDAPKFFQVAKHLVTLLKGCTFVAHNARFDYSFLKKEFAELGYTFHKPVVCTVRLARELFPGLPNYRLSTICKALGISMEGAHRALADALATTELFKRLQAKTDHVEPTLLPAGLTRDHILALPNATGVYTFYNDANEIVYIGKSKNIRKRVVTHFMPDHKSYKPVFFKNSVSRLGAEVVGSELLALLRESEEIKTHRPPLNRMGKRMRDHIGVYLKKNENAHHTLKVLETKKTTNEPVLSFGNIKNARRSLERLAAYHRICARFVEGVRFDICPRCGIHGCVDNIPKNTHNQSVAIALRPYRFPAETCLIEDKGPTSDTRSLMVVHQNKYIGYAVINESSRFGNFQEVINELRRPAFPLVDARELIVSYLSQNSRVLNRSQITFPSEEGKIKALYFKLLLPDSESDAN